MHILPNLQVMLLVFVVFIITMYFMNRLVFKPLISFMDAREAKINNDLKNAGMNTDEIAVIEEEIQKTIRDAKVQAHNLIEEEVRNARENAKNNVEKVQAENKVKLDSFIVQLQSNREAFKKQVIANLPELEEVLKDKIQVSKGA